MKIIHCQDNTVDIHPSNLDVAKIKADLAQNHTVAVKAAKADKEEELRVPRRETLLLLQALRWVSKFSTERIV